MVNFNNTTTVVADNTVVINGQLTFKLTDEQTHQLVSILNGFKSQSVSNTVSTPTANVTPTPKTQKESKQFPNLGTPKASVGFCTQYKNAIRYWENSFTPDKVKYGIKKSLTESGAVWSKEIGAFVFKTIKEADEFMKAQKNRESK